MTSSRENLAVVADIIDRMAATAGQLGGHVIEGRVGALSLFVTDCRLVSAHLGGGCDREALQDLAGRLWPLGVTS